jgi:hypothetical protein
MVQKVLHGGAIGSRNVSGGEPWRIKCIQAAATTARPICGIAASRPLRRIRFEQAALGEVGFEGVEDVGRRIQAAGFREVEAEVEAKFVAKQLGFFENFRRYRHAFHNDHLLVVVGFSVTHP